VEIETESPASCSARNEVLARAVALAAIPEHPGEDGLGLGRAIRVTGGEQGIASAREGVLLTLLVVRPVQGVRMPEEQPRPLGVIGPESKRILVLRSRDREVVQRERAVAGVA
jgi:hypothetical protein